MTQEVTKEQGERVTEIANAAAKVVGVLLILFCPSVWGRFGGLILLTAHIEWIDDKRWIAKRD